MIPANLGPQLRAIREPRMRVLALVDAVVRAPVTALEAWVEAFAQVVGRPDDDDADILETVTQVIADPALPYATRQTLYQIAIDTGRSALARLFLTASPTTVPPEQIVKALAPERSLKPTGRPLALGERKALARTHKREELLLLLRDPHPAVVAILLDNPHVTEADIVRIAAARPAVPESLARVAVHPRWSLRHTVKRALVQNPATPLADAIRIATTLRATNRAELATDPSLPEALLKHLQELS